MNDQNARFVKVALVFAALASFVLYAFALLFGNLNQDEGWYLYAAKCVAAGLQPYRDFFFTQGPLLPAVYGALASFWAPAGVLGGRVLTVAFGLASCVLAGFLASLAVPRDRRGAAGVLGFAFLAGNLYHIYFTTIPKTYALAALLVFAGYLLLALAEPVGVRRTPARTVGLGMAGGFLIALAAGTRLSMGMLLPVTALMLLLGFHRHRWAFLWFSIGGALGLLTVFGPTLLHAPESFFFAQTFHTARRGHDPVFMIGSLSRLVRFYLPVVAFAVALPIALLFRGRPTGTAGASDGGWPRVWLAAFLGVFLLQLASPYPYDDYQVPVMGLLAVAVAVWAVTESPVHLYGRICLLGVLLTLASSFGSPLAQEWMVVRQDRFWAVKKKATDLHQLHAAAQQIRQLVLTPREGEDQLLTQDTYLAVETGLRVPSGLEMGPFSYFPHLGDAEAQKFHVLNKRLLLELIEKTPAATAAVSGYGFAVRSPEMDEVPSVDQYTFREALESRYDLTDSIPDFGQNYTALRIYSRRPAPDSVFREN